jgi:hypothetical protein
MTGAYKGKRIRILVRVDILGLTDSIDYIPFFFLELDGEVLRREAGCEEWMDLGDITRETGHSEEDK